MTQGHKAGASQEHLDRQAPKVIRAVQGYQELQVSQVCQGRRGTRVCQASLAPRASQEREASLDPPWRGPRESQG